jgi:glutaredoxin 3
MTFTVYTKPACPFCDQAKALLKSQNLQFKVVNLDVGQSKEAGEDYITREELLAKIPTARTMPQIFDGDHHVGGYSELKTYLLNKL